MTEEKYNDGRDNPYVMKAGLIPLLMRYVHVTPWMVMRELVSNGIDQYIEPGQENKDPLIHIQLSKYRKSLIGRDYATGIQNLERFKIIGNDFFEGIGKLMSTGGNGDVKLDPRFIGQYHIAKLTYVSASTAQSDKVRIYSNNGHESRILTMRDFGWGKEQNWDNNMQTPVFPETGLKVEILEPKKELLSARNMYTKLSEWFGIKLARKHIKIRIDDFDKNKYYMVQKPGWLKTDNEVEIDKLKGGGVITGRFEPMMKPTHEKTIYVHVKYVGVTWLQCDYLASGWINCDALTTEMDLSRDRFIQGDLLEEIIEKLNKYFEKNDYEKAVREKRTFKNTQKLEELANLAMRVANQIFDSDVELSGKPAPNNPDNDNPDEEGDDEKVKTEVEKRHPNTSDEKDEKTTHRKPPENEDEEKRERTPKETHWVNRSTGVNTNSPNVEVEYGYFGPLKPVLYFETAELLHLNLSRDSSSLITTSSPLIQGKTGMTLMAKAVTDFRTRDLGLSVEASNEKFYEVLDSLWRQA